MSSNKTKNIIFDVGANDGSSCYPLCSEDSVVYAFEPTPQLIREYLLPRASDKYVVIPKAVSDFDGKTIFNIAGQADWGCSSLNNFSDKLHDTWPGRDDFKVTEKITVDVTRMDTFIEENGINHVHYLHCDTQGSDLKVLKSFGKYINIIESGVVEAYEKNPLYQESDNNKEAIIKFLEDHNFMITDITSNDSHNNEVNIHFKSL
jgi:FkbM family methyltransferase